MASDWDVLVTFFPGYKRKLAESGYKDTRLVPASGQEEAKILTVGAFGEACGAVVAEVYVWCRGGQLVQEARIARSAVGNRGWNGGSDSAAPRNEREAVRFATEYLMQARQILS